MNEGYQDINLYSDTQEVTPEILPKMFFPMLITGLVDHEEGRYVDQCFNGNMTEFTHKI